MSAPAYYFAYGSNMNPARVAARIGETRVALAGVLRDYRLCFDKASRVPGISHANVVASQGAWVEGVLIGLTHPEQIQAMDPFEGYPQEYQRHRLPVHSEEGVIDAWVYIARPGTTGAGLQPAREYLAHLLHGRAFLSSEYHAWLADFSSVTGLDEETLMQLGVSRHDSG
ncbi:gamma-glutamylcyclotransferase family protein [Halomonas halmophila]|uniref:Gamma-glutamylcyclotransferase n=1 Tax=Halomonas halmophila TaxID=252 RepID=A0A4Y4EY95_9GAMM|nr:gamma-glutamylcyclotransferase family protein [Halomonas halmophila]GED22053.1 gamma-glutamylcyclotransferase [Halomonas halmophila]